MKIVLLRKVLENPEFQDEFLPFMEGSSFRFYHRTFTTVYCPVTALLFSFKFPINIVFS